MAFASGIPRNTPWPLLTGHYSTSPLFDDDPNFSSDMRDMRREQKGESPTMTSSPLPSFFKQLEMLKGNVGRLSQSYSASDLQSQTTASPQTSASESISRSTTCTSMPSSPPGPVLAELDSTPREIKSRAQPPAKLPKQRPSPPPRRRRAESIIRQQESAEQVTALWKQYVDCVHPLLKFVDTSTMQHLFYPTSRSTKPVGPDAEALRSAICFAAAASLQRPSSNANSCSILENLLQTHSQGVETRLAEARFMSDPTIMTLQALTIYLTCGRYFLDGSYVWSMTAVLVRLATKLKLHKDPEAQGLPFSDCEYRRRLWWHICTLDTLTAADSDSNDPLVYERQCTTRFPEWSTDPNCAHYLRDMFYSLVRFEITYYSRTVLFSDEFTQDNGYPLLPLSGKLSIVDSLSNILEEKYFRRSRDRTSPSYTLTVASANISVAELKLAVLKAPYSPTASTRACSSPKPQFPSLNTSETTHLLNACVDILQALCQLRADPSLSPFSWLWNSPADWRSAATCLLGLAAYHRTVPEILRAAANPGSAVTNAAAETAANRAWTAIDAFFDAWKDSHRDPTRQEEWMRLNHLRAEAEEAKAQTVDAAKEAEIKKAKKMLEKRRRSFPVVAHTEPVIRSDELTAAEWSGTPPVPAVPSFDAPTPGRTRSRKDDEEAKKAYRLSSAMAPSVDFRRSVSYPYEMLCVQELEASELQKDESAREPAKSSIGKRPATVMGHRAAPLSSHPVSPPATAPTTPAATGRNTSDIKAAKRPSLPASAGSSSSSTPRYYANTPTQWDPVPAMRNDKDTEKKNTSSSNDLKKATGTTAADPSDATKKKSRRRSIWSRSTPDRSDTLLNPKKGEDGYFDLRSW